LIAFLGIAHGFCLSGSSRVGASFQEWKCFIAIVSQHTSETMLWAQQFTEKTHGMATGHKTKWSLHLHVVRAGCLRFVFSRDETHSR